MAVVVNGVNVTKTKLKAWKRAVDSGRRTPYEIENTELGTSGRGKTVTRLFERELENA